MIYPQHLKMSLGMNGEAISIVQRKQKQKTSIVTTMVSTNGNGLDRVDITNNIEYRTDI